jgi:hypothetical protein
MGSRPRVLFFVVWFLLKIRDIVQSKNLFSFAQLTKCQMVGIPENNIGTMTIWLIY